jgi:hypothetical protein
MLQLYLTNLAHLQTRLKALPPMKIIVDSHEKLLAKRRSNEQKAAQLYTYMVDEYEKLAKRIDSL